MANLTENANWEANIYRIDQTDPVLGWDGSNINIANQQAQQLANRTTWLKQRVDLGQRLTGTQTFASSGPVPANVFNGQLLRIDTNGGAVVLTLPPLSSVADGGNALVSNEYGAGYNWLSSVNNDFSFIPAAGDSCIDIITGETWNNGSSYWPLYQPGTVVAIHKIGATTWAVYRIHEWAQSPPGIVQAWAANVPPAGWLECNGATLNRTQFANLFAVIGTTFGAPSGSTFKIPDLRGEFIRGWDNGRGIDSGRAFGSAQGDTIKDHSHFLFSQTAGNITNTGATSYATSSGNSNASNIHTTNTVSSPNGGGTETRPRNVALVFCIKF